MKKERKLVKKKERRKINKRRGKISMEEVRKEKEKN